MPMKVKKFKLCRRLGSAIFDQCANPSFDSTKRRTKGRPKHASDYGKQLIEKQKVRFSYGVTEKQFRNYVNKAIAKRSKTATPAEMLFQMLESRLDNVIYRAKLAPTRRAARQLVSHGHFVVNNVRVNVPSYNTSAKDAISVRAGSKTSPYFQKEFTDTSVPNWLTVKPTELLVAVAGEPKNPDPFLDFQSVIEFYSR